ncbi:uncharacterized protein F5Z01DRAFT_506955 [Emericellopsis atlantica]|uniref:Uncharacterized protein n=1 Tax=Emericellopsis atlantica TaxID=2614577 RepID=A0A9P7ZR96_9HYPO|nr:uncharacterized protein F5Z01DRAFT_506955 [Emericellopsis atlantica]KAG9256372.1 hypothetical protein F5Z01DRAFT_506955 [Emericellopsis atlantica]
MSASQLPSIDDQLVTPANPPRTDRDGMDYERCAALHNYLLDYCLAIEGRLDQVTEGSRATYWSEHGAAAEALRPRLHHSVVAFLERAYEFDDENPLSYFVANMRLPGDGSAFLLDNELADLLDQPEDSVVFLYMASCESFDDDAGGGGLLYHQGRHQATFAAYPEHTECAFPMDQHPQSWHAFETILSHWIDLIHLGKVVASPIAKEDRRDGFKVGNWEWWSYGDGQIATCVAAWDRLCHAIEARRRPPGAGHVDNMDDKEVFSEHEPLLTPAALDAANVPDPSFARGFLSRARRPRHIQQIAPGLSLPPADATTFAAAQRFTNLPRRVRQYYDSWEEGIVPPVYMFFSKGGVPEVDISDWNTSFQLHWSNGQRKIADDIPFPPRVPRGVYSECVVRSHAHATEEGFRLLLPFTVPGALYSDGNDIRNFHNEVDELFQHGFKPLGGEAYRTQRLERLFDHFASLVERGVWSVGPHGVQGSIDVFKDAAVHCEDYRIPSTW